MPDTDEYVTTGAAAKVLGTNHKHVIRLADKGVLRSWLVPGSKHRRVSIEDVRRHMAEAERLRAEAAASEAKDRLGLLMSCSSIRRLKDEAKRLGTTASALVERMIDRSIQTKEGAKG